MSNPVSFDDTSGVSFDDILDASTSERYPVTAALEAEGWRHPLSVGPDEREAVTAENMRAIARHQARVAKAVALFGSNGDQEQQA